MEADLVAGRSAREGAAVDDIEAWMERRKTQVGQFVRDAEVAGRQAWNDATRTGQSVLARTSSELAALGSRRLQAGSVGTAFLQGRSHPAAKSWLDQSPAAKTAGGSVAQLAGNVAGVGQGIWHSAKGLGEGLLFVSRLADPDDAELSGPDRAAWGQVFSAGKRTVDYINKSIANPAGVASDVQRVGRKLYADTVPSATPIANTFGGEMRRNFDLGRNQGELDWDIGSLLFGGAAFKALRGVGATTEAGGAVKFMGQRFSPSPADYLAAPYKGMGHHFIPRNALKPIQLPRALSDSPLNLLKPAGMNRGDFYALHYAVDPYFNTANLPAAVGGGTWNGAALGLQKYGPWASLWHASPAPLNATVGVTGAANLANFQPSGEQRQ